MKLSESDIARFWTFVDKGGPNDCWLWQGGGKPEAYGRFSVGPRRSAKTYLAHRVSYFITKGPTRLLVCHECDIRRCVNPKHLFAGTHKRNQEDCKNKERKARGELHGRHVLSERDVTKIIRLRSSGHSGRCIASQLHRPKSTVENVLAGRTWSWLTGIVAA